MVKLLPQKGETRAAFVDFVEIEDARVLAAAPSVSRAQTFMLSTTALCVCGISNSACLWHILSVLVAHSQRACGSFSACLWLILSVLVAHSQSACG